MQYAFDFSPPAPTYAQIVVGLANRRAVELLQTDTLWPGAWLCVTGPPRCGRTRLAQIWTAGDGVVLTPETFNAAPLIDLDRTAGGRIALDDADGGLDDDRLLHLLNQARTAGGKVLLTARRPPVDWSATQPDLVSRLRSMTVVTIDLPDAGMMHDLFEAACHAHHIGLPDEVWTYLERRVPRDYAAIESLAGEMCAAVSGTGRGLTVPVARHILGDTDDPGADGEADDD